MRWVLVAAALILPYVAVVMANASNSKPDGFELIGGGSGHAELPAAPDTPTPPHARAGPGLTARGGVKQSQSELSLPRLSSRLVPDGSPRGCPAPLISAGRAFHG